MKTKIIRLGRSGELPAANLSLSRHSMVWGRRSGCRSSGFSLLELLVVMAIIVILAFGASALIKSSTPGGVNAGIVQVADLLELSKNEAITHKTYVWVAFQEITSPLGIPQLQMGAVYSLDGTGSNTAQNNQGILSRVRTVPQLTLIPWNKLKATTSGLYSFPSLLDLANNTTGIPSCVIGSTSFPANPTSVLSITFTPRGQAMLSGAVVSTSGYDAYIDVSFQQTRGNSATVSEDGAVVVDGSTGAVTLVRHA